MCEIRFSFKTHIYSYCNALKCINLRWGSIYLYLNGMTFIKLFYRLNLISYLSSNFSYVTIGIVI